ncbi:MAG: XdhC family protein, partial [Gammaproteobacteria bacterium]
SRPEQPQHLSFTLGAATDQCCGGRVEAQVVPIDPPLATLFAARWTRVYRYGAAGVLQLAGGYDARGRWLGNSDSPPPPWPACSTLGPTPDGQWFVRPAQRAIPLWLFGAGHVARSVARFGAELGYAVHVFDSRPEWADPTAFPRQSSVYAINQPPPDLTPDRDTVVLIMTHSHSLDYALLKRFHRCPLAYLGVIGSRSKAARFRQALRREGLDDSALHMPIGLMDLGKRPAEIAVSVLAELLALRARQVEAQSAPTEESAHA